MNRKVLIIVGSAIVLFLLGIWIYMLFFSTPTNEQGGETSGIFSNFNLNDTGSRNDGSTDATNSDSQNNPGGIVDLTTPKKLRQLTTKNVAGYSEVEKASSTAVYFVESGLGHVYEIDFETGEERRLSGVTIPASTDASIRSDGEYFVIKIQDKNYTDLAIGHFDSSSSSATVAYLGESVTDFTINSAGDLLYAVKTSAGTIGKSYDFETGVIRELFNVPFRESRVLWSQTVGGSHFIFPKAASLLEGYVYEVDNGTMSRIPVSGYGLSTVAGNDFVLITSRTDTQYTSVVFDLEDSSVQPVEYAVVPEKCAFNYQLSTQLVCARELGKPLTRNAPDDWYQGVVKYTDSLWSVSTETGELTLLSNLTEESGREIDVINPSFGSYAPHVYFQNKLDNSLWLYEYTTPSTEVIDEVNEENI